MPPDLFHRPPAIYRWWLCLAAAMAPRAARSACLARWLAALEDWWILVERGELPGADRGQVARWIGEAFREALGLRFGGGFLRRWMRGPALLLAAGPLVLAAIALVSHGFLCTRTIIAVELHPCEYIPYGHDAAWSLSAFDLVFAHAFTLVFTLVVGASLVVLTHRPLKGNGWRYWWFLTIKITWVAIAIPLLWIESGALMRAAFRHHFGILALLCVTSALALIVGFGASLAWCFGDQRRRCPVCLRRLVLPVTIGSWASVLEPVTTELVCEEGHGSLSMFELAAGPNDRWVALDASWRPLFDRERV